MTVRVRDLLDVTGMALHLVAGGSQAARQIRWVHVSELEDPTPWLKGGELLLTTGMGVGDTPAKQRAYVRRLSEAGLAGLGFGLGFSHDRVPRAIVTAADRIEFPVFEVPYPVPFIAITEAVFTRILAGQFDTLQRAVEAEHVLTRDVMDGNGVEGIASSLAAVTKGWALLLDLHGLPLAATSRAATARVGRVWEEVRASRPEGTSFSLSLVDGGHHVWIQPVGAQGRVEAFLAVGKLEQPSQLDRIVAGHALSLFAIELAKSRAVADAERRLQGDFFDQLARGDLSAADAARGLARFGFSREAQLMAVTIEGADAEALARAAEDLGSRTDDGFLIARRNDGDGVSVLLPASAANGIEQLVTTMGARAGATLRGGSGSAVAPSEVGRSLREARYALQVCRMEGWTAAGFEDLGTYRLLLSMSDPDALRAFADSLLGPLDVYDRNQQGELLPSVQAFLEHNSRWETAAAELYVHRHTLRYRMRKVEELTGRDLSSSFDRMEFWLALRARDLLTAGTAS